MESMAAVVAGKSEAREDSAAAAAVVERPVETVEELAALEAVEALD